MPLNNVILQTMLILLGKVFFMARHTKFFLANIVSFILDDPKLVLTMGSSAKVGLVREIERSQLDCTITANPPHTKFGWTFNGVPLTQTGNSNLLLTFTSIEYNAK